MQPADLLKTSLGLTGKDRPFCWQSELLSRFAKNDLPPALDIPTGLGKTAVMAIWLVARACGATNLPRRLVYVVDRRTVVDQATEEAMKLHAFVAENQDVKESLGLETDEDLPVSTLRGQHIDNKKWLENPTSPAIIVGTVDMIGSRLLFEGYGVSRKMRPYHAALLGVDTLVVLDESHLVPPFEKLIESIARRQGCGTGQYDGLGAGDADLEQIIPKLRLLSLSATGRTGEGAFGLTEGDLKAGTVTRKRLDAKKRLILHQTDDAAKLVDTLAAMAWEICDKGESAVRIIVFCDRRKDALDTRSAIRKLANKGKNATAPDWIEPELFVGGRRVFEREQAAKTLKALGFIAGSIETVEKPTFLIATSAAEVGVDLDADHMVCDLVAWERMVQRLGRVNRRGDGDATIIVVEPPPSATNDEKAAFKKSPDARTKKDEESIEKYRKKLKTERDKWRPYREAVQFLPSDNSGFDASPGAIRQLKLDAAKEFKNAKAKAPKLINDAATEVGLNLDADFIDGEVKAWEKLLGILDCRRDAPIELPPDPEPPRAVAALMQKTETNRTKSENRKIEKHREKVAKEREKWSSYFESVQVLRAAESSDISTCRALLHLNMASQIKVKFIEEATTPPPLRPGLSRALVDAWSMTSLKKHTGRPIVAPWLRGWVDDEPQTAIVWRKHLPHRGKLPDGKRAKQRYIRDIEAFFEAAPPHLSEVLETETYKVLDWLEQRAIALSTTDEADVGTALPLDQEPCFAIVLDSAINVAVTNDRTGCLAVNDVIFRVTDETLSKTQIGDQKKKWVESFQTYLAGKTIVVDSRFGGLPDSGLLEEKCDSVPRTADDSINEDDIWNREDENREPVVKWFVRHTGGDEADEFRESESETSDVDESDRKTDLNDVWKERLRFVLNADADTDNPPALIVYKWKGDSSIEDDRSTGFWQSLEDHKLQAEQRAESIADKLGLPPQYTKMLKVVARLHDEGKLAANWQNAFTQKAPQRPSEFNGKPLAKTPGPIDFQILNHYRHEFGSLLHIEQNGNGQYDDFYELPEHLRELGLHLIAAHHGFARPIIATEGCEDAPPSVLKKQALQIAIRFARLQKRWGPWGLAWWESLLRAADQQASREAIAEFVSTVAEDA